MLDNPINLNCILHTNANANTKPIKKETQKILPEKQKTICCGSDSGHFGLVGNDYKNEIPKIQKELSKEVKEIMDEMARADKEINKLIKQDDEPITFGLVIFGIIYVLFLILGFFLLLPLSLFALPWIFDELEQN